MTDLRGQVVATSRRVVGTGPIVAGAFRGRRALLSLTPELGSKFFYQLRRDGPARYIVTIRRLDAPGRGGFEVQQVDGTGRTARGFVPVLRLDRHRVARSHPPRRGDVLLGQPGSIRLPAAGCYAVRARWPGGEWNRRFVARLAGR
jgi:hypothetical protein